MKILHNILTRLRLDKDTTKDELKKLVRIYTHGYLGTNDFVEQRVDDLENKVHSLIVLVLFLMKENSEK